MTQLVNLFSQLEGSVVSFKRLVVYAHRPDMLWYYNSTCTAIYAQAGEGKLARIATVEPFTRVLRMLPGRPFKPNQNSRYWIYAGTIHELPKARGMDRNTYTLRSVIHVLAWQRCSVSDICEDCIVSPSLQYVIDNLESSEEVFEQHLGVYAYCESEQYKWLIKAIRRARARRLK
jgi:hypothetical protein